MTRRRFFAVITAGLAWMGVKPQTCEHRFKLKERTGWKCAECEHREVFRFDPPLDAPIRGWERFHDRLMVFTERSVYDAGVYRG